MFFSCYFGYTVIVQRKRALVTLIFYKMVPIWSRSRVGFLLSKWIWFLMCISNIFISILSQDKSSYMLQNRSTCMYYNFILRPNEFLSAPFYPCPWIKDGTHNHQLDFFLKVKKWYRSLSLCSCLKICNDSIHVIFGWLIDKSTPFYQPLFLLKPLQ